MTYDKWVISDECADVQCVCRAIKSTKLLFYLMTNKNSIHNVFGI